MTKPVLQKLILDEVYKYRPEERTKREGNGASVPEEKHEGRDSGTFQ